jgi:uncharacterized protein (UPF0333 family)
MTSNSHIKAVLPFSARGQAAVEYLLTLGGIFLALSGSAVLFNSVFRRMLGILSALVRNAFYQ